MKWRKEAIQALELPIGATVLDLGSGTGDMLFEILQHYPSSTVVGVDFTPEMVQIGRRRKGLERVLWVIADVQNLPFPHSTFNGTSSAFLMRNLFDVNPAFKEQNRVLCDEGRLVCLETTPPPKKPLNLLKHFYLKLVIPIWGGLISKDLDAYAYLADSTIKFLTPEKLAERIISSGFCEVRFIRRMFGMVAIHIARKD